MTMAYDSASLELAIYILEHFEDEEIDPSLGDVFNVFDAIEISFPNVSFRDFHGAFVAAQPDERSHEERLDGLRKVWEQMQGEQEACPECGLCNEIWKEQCTHDWCPNKSKGMASWLLR